jgi:hypothetical protein
LSRDAAEGTRAVQLEDHCLPAFLLVFAMAASSPLQVLERRFPFNR